jgi:hypothetical protein
VADWQPMETAPKDGTRVLLWSEEWTAACTGQYYGEPRGWGVFYDVGMFKHQPTHWQPLPEPPK